MTSLNLEKPLLRAMAYTFLVASSFSSCCSFYNQQKYLSIGFIPFGLCFITGSLGTWIYTQILMKNHGNIKTVTIKLFEIIKFITNLYALPLVIGDMYLKYELSVDLVIAHMFLPILGLVPCGVIKCDRPVTLQIRDTTIIPKYKLQTPNFKFKQYIDSMDFVTFVSTISLSVLSCLGNNMFGVFAAIIYAMTYFIITEKGQIGNCVPAEPFHVMGMGVFCGLAMKALSTFYLQNELSCITINK